MKNTTKNITIHSSVVREELKLIPASAVIVQHVQLTYPIVIYEYRPSRGAEPPTPERLFAF